MVIFKASDNDVRKLQPLRGQSREEIQGEMLEGAVEGPMESLSVLEGTGYRSGGFHDSVT